jgi:transketolase
MNSTVKELESTAKKIRYDIVQMIGPGKTGHLGGSCSIADVVTVLYFRKMKHDPKNPKMPDRDRFLLSKGHSALVQYAALAESGYFPVEELLSLKKMGSRLQGHPDMMKLPGIEANTGSLGQGLSIAAGIAAAGKIDKLDYTVYCVVGDGEIAEGQIWEAAMAASFYKLDNLVAILDKNCLQATGCIAERFNTNPLNEKWTSFGWHVMECDGHNMQEIIESLDKADSVTGKPVIIIANTIKGCGISFAENVVAFHNGAMTPEQYELALQELGGK